MKKFTALLLAALLPFAAYLAFFIAFEPNNYFGLKDKDTMFTRIIGYKNDKPQSIIIGDSRLANFDMKLVNDTSGRSWHNLAFGGASLEESLDLLEYAKEINPDLKEAIIGLSFYTLNKSYGTVSRMATIEKQINNPAAYITNFQYNIDAAVNLINVIKKVPLGAEHETAQWTEADYIQNGEKLAYRKGLIAYSSLLYSNCGVQGVPKSALGSIDAMLSAMDSGTLSAKSLMNEMLEATPLQSRFSVNQEQLERLVAVAKEFEKSGIKLTIVMPPMHDSVRKLVCDPLGIDKAMQPALELLEKSGVRVLDYEWKNAPNYPDDSFFDGFHLDLLYGLPEWTKALFSEV